VALNCRLHIGERDRRTQGWKGQEMRFNRGAQAFLLK
jgi:hypothetical protein